MSKLESKIKIADASEVTDAVLWELRAAAASIDKRIAVNSMGIFIDQWEVRTNLTHALFHIRNALEKLANFREPTDLDYDVM